MVQKNSVNKRIIIICGATATGKSALAANLARAIDSEVVYADSMDVYKSLDIGTAKPTADEMLGVKHYMIDVVEPEREFSVGDYKELAKPIVDDILSRGKTPVICGGTGFYINSLLYELSYGNGKANEEVREKYKKLASEKGNLYVYNVLKEIDAVSAEKIHYNDVKRVIRALEIASTGKIKSEIIDDATPVYDYLAYAVSPDRETLYDNINCRVDKMIDLGLVDEVKGLIKRGITINNQCMQGIGYKEIYAYLCGEIDLKSAIESIKLNTRHYAKRQITFFKRLPNLVNLPYEKTEVLTERIIKEL